jgi:hypothetical protein
MGGAQQTQLTGWHLKVRNWLQDVINHQQRMFYAEFRRAAAENQGSFPKAILPIIAAHLYKPFAVWLVKSALKEAAADLGISIDDATLSFLANLAVDALMATV